MITYNLLAYILPALLSTLNGTTMKRLTSVVVWFDLFNKKWTTATL